MKKSLIALAVLAASGAAMAQSTVTLYGIIDTYLQSGTVENALNATAASVTTTKLESGSVNGSRWGLKGAEDLGGGMKANFQLESGFSNDTGAAGQGGLLFGRHAWVGLSGDFGAIRFGRTPTPFFDNEGNDDTLLNSGLSAQQNVFRTANGYNTAVFGLGTYTLRTNNSIRYDMPAVSGFNGAISYSLNERVDKALSVTSFDLAYAAGPLGVTLAYQKEATDYVTTAKPANYADLNVLRLSGQYNLGAVVLKAGYGKAGNVLTVSGADTTESTVGFDFPATAALTLTAGYARSSDNVTAGDATRTAYALGGKYVMSKRTFLYFGYENGKQELTGRPDAKQTLLAAGMQHRF